MKQKACLTPGSCFCLCSLLRTNIDRSADQSSSCEDLSQEVQKFSAMGGGFAGLCHYLLRWALPDSSSHDDEESDDADDEMRIPNQW